MFAACFVELETNYPAFVLLSNDLAIHTYTQVYVHVCKEKTKTLQIALKNTYF